MSGARAHTIIESPLGPITLVADDGTLCGLYFDAHRHGPTATQIGPVARGLLQDAAMQIEAYFAGDRTGFDLSLRMNGTPFQKDVWAALRDIPYGQTETYSGLADRIGRPRAARAVGAANARNPISLIVPCHRVVGRGGHLTGYGGGLDRKKALLDMERSRPIARRSAAAARHRSAGGAQSAPFAAHS